MKPINKVTHQIDIYEKPGLKGFSQTGQKYAAAIVF